MTRIDFRNPRILTWIVAIAISLLFILSPITLVPQLGHGLKYGMDLAGGSSLQLQLQGAMVQIDADPVKILQEQFGTVSVEKRGENSYQVEVPGRVAEDAAENLGYLGANINYRDNRSIITVPASPGGVIINYLENALDTDVRIVGVAPVVYEIRTDVTRKSLEEILAPVGGSVPPGDDAFVEGVTAETVDDTKRVLDQKLNRLGLQDIRVRTVSNQFILVDLAGVDVATAQDIVGKPGKFEIRIQTQGNESEHVLYGDAVSSVDIPQADQNGMWGVPFVLSEEGALAFRDAAIRYGATTDPQNHYISMYLDKDLIFSAPLAPDLASGMSRAPIRQLQAEVGAGDQGSAQAKQLYIHLSEGALPVNVEIIGSGQVTAALGDQFMRQILVAGLISLLVVAGLIYRRYREMRIVLPMLATSFSEVVLMLGFASIIGWNLDLASIAAIILVIGTGIDHLVIITDELLRGGEAVAATEGMRVRDRAAIISERIERESEKARVVESRGKGGAVAALSVKDRASAAAEKAQGPSGKVYFQRLSRAFAIILGAAATTIMAMIPLLVMGFGSLTGFALIIIVGVIIGVGVARPAYGRIIGYVLSNETKGRVEA